MTEITPAQAIELLDALEDQLHTIARLGHAVWLCAAGLDNTGADDRAAVGELGEQIERLAHETEAQRGAAYVALKRVVERV
jgi:hypothetical protein